MQWEEQRRWEAVEFTFPTVIFCIILTNLMFLSKKEKKTNQEGERDLNENTNRIQSDISNK